MAPKSVLLVTFNILFAIVIVGAAIAGREMPNTDSKNTNMKQPESFIDKDGRILVPGIGGGFTLPGVQHSGGGGFNPFTGTNGGLGLPSFGGTGDDFGTGGGAATPRSYIPGGDDTFVPNPGFEVPIPGGSTPVAALARP